LLSYWHFQQPSLTKYFICMESEPKAEPLVFVIPWRKAGWLNVVETPQKTSTIQAYGRPHAMEALNLSGYCGQLWDTTMEVPFLAYPLWPVRCLSLNGTFH
jgi:hypothetical protein